MKSLVEKQTVRCYVKNTAVIKISAVCIYAISVEKRSKGRACKFFKTFTVYLLINHMWVF